MSATIPMTWTVNEILARLPELGIPHFQRGLVWGYESTADLLESLYHEIPCGMFVLWKAPDSSRYGIPLKPPSAGGFAYLIIDGQQRIRSLDSVFRADANGVIWCLNFAALPEFAKEGPPEERRWPLFVGTQMSSGLERTADIPRRFNNALPIGMFEGATAWDDPTLAAYRARFTLTKTKLAEYYPTIRRRILGLKEQCFFISIQESECLASMVNLYNRINSKGAQVQVEEQAFARLLSSQPCCYDELRDTFAEVHGTEPSGSEQGSDARTITRDEVLKRLKERSFGFKLFVRIFLQVCEHELAVPKSKRDLTFDLTERSAYMTAFAHLDSAQATELWRETRRVLSRVRALLRENLYCDDLRMLPETTCLGPLFELLIHYPGLDNEDYSPLLASMCIRLLLAELDSQTLQGLIHIARDPSQTLIPILKKFLETTTPRVSRADLTGRLGNANSTQNRYVLLLYCVERWRKAKDFRYDKLDPLLPHPELVPGKEVPLGETCAPEKQHLLPFKKAQLLFPDLRRASSHPVNGLGNLTYISQQLNDYDGGLGDNFAELGDEPPDNLKAHFMIGPDEQKGPDEYMSLQKHFSEGRVEHLKECEAAFEDMVAKRREWILNGFLKWIEELDEHALKKLGIDSFSELDRLEDSATRLEPARPRFPICGRPDAAYAIRDLSFPNDIKDELVRLSRFAKATVGFQIERPPYTLQLTRLKRIWIELDPPAITLCFDAKVPPAVRGEVCKLLELPENEMDLKAALVRKNRSEQASGVDALIKQLPDIEKKLSSASHAGDV